MFDYFLRNICSGKTKQKFKDFINGSFFLQKEVYRDFPGGPVVKNPPSNAGDAGSIPGQETKILHSAGQRSPCTVTTEPTHSIDHVPQLGSP